jgi:predicted DNA-binding WGR domain protein
MDLEYLSRRHADATARAAAADSAPARIAHQKMARRYAEQIAADDQPAEPATARIPDPR